MEKWESWSNDQLPKQISKESYIDDAICKNCSKYLGNGGCRERIKLVKEDDHCASFDKREDRSLTRVKEENIVIQEHAKEVGKIITFFQGKKDLAYQILRIQPLFYDSYKMWWIWNKKEYRWIMGDETDIMNLVSNYSMANTISSKEKNEIIEALKQTSRLNQPLPMKNTWVQFNDTIIDIDSGEFFEANSSYLITNPIPYRLSADGSTATPNMDRIFKEWVGEEHMQTLYEVIAYCLIPSYPINRIFCLYGYGLNGKSKYLELLRKFIGKNNCCATDLDVLLKSRFEKTRLHKKLVCQMGETNFDQMTSTARLKELSGGDAIGFEYKNKLPFEDVNYAKIIISTNNLPPTTDKTIGFYRRWCILDFPNQFTEKKDILADIPEEEYRALARKCIFILKNLLQVREFHKEGDIEERQKKYESRSNFLEKFIETYTSNEDPNAFITKSVFNKRFSDWCKENRNRQMSETSLASAMKDIGIEGGKEYIEWFTDDNRSTQKQVRVWRGIKWKNIY